jgi:5'-methylthioadenosine phosphorylase
VQRIVGVIGGSGLYEMAGLAQRAGHRVVTPFGEPSDEIVSGEIAGTRYLFLPRHGRGHRLAPHEIDYRSNILALKQLGAQQIISVSAVGSLREDVHPGDVVLVDQFIDRTKTRVSTFFEGLGVVAHVGFADPTDRALGDSLERAAKAVGARVHRGGTYVCIEGPQFSTRAESDVFRSWGGSVIGMTNLPEARLAREAQLPYATLALVTDYDCWKTDEAPVTVAQVIAMLRANVALAQRMLVAVANDLPDPALSPASTALASAILTPADRISAEARAKLATILTRPD